MRPTHVTIVLAGMTALTGAPGVDPGPASCVVSGGGPEYYAFELVGTKTIPGTGLARGRAEVSLLPSSPFSVALTEEGSYRYEVRVHLERMRPPRSGVLVAWVTTNDLREVRRLGPLGDDLSAQGAVSWNKFLVVVSLEEDDDPSAHRWAGPVAFRGMSRSGMMHTMAGHGALQEENCAAYGYDE